MCNIFGLKLSHDSLSCGDFVMGVNFTFWIVQEILFLIETSLLVHVSFFVIMLYFVFTIVGT